MSALREVATDVWVAERPLKLAVGDIGARMTVVRLQDGGLFLHSPVRATRTLVLTDLAFNVPEAATGARLFHWFVGARGRFGPHRLVRLLIGDRRAARQSIERILRWGFDRVIVSHGENLETGGRDSLAAAFAFL